MNFKVGDKVRSLRYKKIYTVREIEADESGNWLYFDMYKARYNAMKFELAEPDMTGYNAKIIINDIEYRLTPIEKKCLVYECTNKSNEGKFVGDLCGPCYEYLTTGRVGPTESFLRYAKYYKEIMLLMKENK